MDEREKLLTLSKEEARVLFFRCKYYKPRDRNNRLVIRRSGYSETPFYKHLDSAYVKLGISGELSREKKWEEVENKYCGVLREVTTEEMIVRGLWPPDNATATPIAPERLGERRVNWRLIWILTAILIIISILLIRRFLPNRPAVVALFSNAVTQTPDLSKGASETAVVVLSTNTVEPALALQTVRATIQAPTIIHSPTDTSIPSTATDTIVPSATNTLVPTETSVPTPVPLFEDNFDSGLSNRWEITGSRPVIGEGQLWARDGFAWMSVGEETWKDYRVEVDIIQIDCPFDGNVSIIGLRIKDLNNMYGLMFNGCATFWGERKDGTNNVWGDTLYNRVSDHLVISVKGNHWSSENGYDFIDPKYTQGKVAIFLLGNMKIDNFKIMALP
ncbi:MAG TPA: hypothetical protein VJ327_09780 [Patescibacteria group bacterium]|nr:MAG: hypothetical protein A2899_02895 [Candidatus Amesbacteria bacterium RIFCSPLOWO2_01_FULL_49_25]HJZ06115.1 hypothetical protein [Patescibacteria group bacterium]